MNGRNVVIIDIEKYEIADYNDFFVRNLLPNADVLLSVSNDCNENDIANMIKNANITKENIYFSNGGFARRINNVLSKISEDYDNCILIYLPLLKLCGSLNDLHGILDVTEKNGIVFPRNNISSLYCFDNDREDKDFEIYQQLKNNLPKTEIVPLAQGGIVAIKTSVLRNFTFFSGYISREACIADFCLRINEVGYSTLLCNTIYVMQRGNRAKPSCLQEGFDFELLESKYPCLMVLIKNYIRWDKLNVVKFGKMIIGNKDEKPKLLINLLNLSPVNNGTSVYGLAITKQLNNRLKDIFDIFILTSRDAAKFHNLNDEYDNILFPDNFAGMYDLAFTPSQFFFWEHFLYVNRHCLKLVFTLLDIIAQRCKYINGGNYFYKAMFEYPIKAADGIVVISDYTLQDTEAYFSNIDFSKKECKRIYLATGDADNKEQTEESDESKPYFFIVGNGYQHKGIKPCMEWLEKSNFNFKVFGGRSDSFVHKNVKYISSGNLSQDEVNKLYRNSIAIIFPSFYEGFGLPILNALNAGKKVIVRNTALNTELKEYFKDYSSDIMEFKSQQELEHCLKIAIEAEPMDKSKHLRNWDNVGIETAEFLVNVLKKEVDLEQLSYRQEIGNLIESSKEYGYNSALQTVLVEENQGNGIINKWEIAKFVAKRCLPNRSYVFLKKLRNKMRAHSALVEDNQGKGIINKWETAKFVAKRCLPNRAYAFLKKLRDKMRSHSL